MFSTCSLTQCTSDIYHNKHGLVYDTSVVEEEKEKLTVTQMN